MDARPDRIAESVEWVASPRQDFGDHTVAFQAQVCPEEGRPMAGEGAGEFEGEGNSRGQSFYRVEW